MIEYMFKDFTSFLLDSKPAHAIQNKLGETKFGEFFGKPEVYGGKESKVGFGKAAASVLPKTVGSLFRFALGHGLPLAVGGAFALTGHFGLGAYLGIKLAQGVRDNLKKNKMLSESPVIDWYKANVFGEDYKILEQSEGEKAYKKMKSNNLGEMPDDYSILASYKNTYDK